jgi:hypothetical protein
MSRSSGSLYQVASVGSIMLMVVLTLVLVVLQEYQILQTLQVKATRVVHLMFEVERIRHNHDIWLFWVPPAIYIFLGSLITIFVSIFKKLKSYNGKGLINSFILWIIVGLVFCLCIAVIMLLFTQNATLSLLTGMTLSFTIAFFLFLLFGLKWEIT